MRAPILFVHSGDNGIRGSERALLDLLRSLDRDRFSPVVWCDAPSLAREVAALSLPVYQDRFCVLLGRVRPHFDLRRYMLLLCKGVQLVERHGIRLLHNNASGTTQWTLPVARTARIPMLVHLHVLDSRARRYKLFLHQAPLAVACSRAVAGPLVEDGMPEERTRIIYCGIDTARLEHGEAGSLRSGLGVPEDAVTATV